jgi:hypothetical protein
MYTFLPIVMLSFLFVDHLGKKKASTAPVGIVVKARIEKTGANIGCAEPFTRET